MPGDVPGNVARVARLLAEAHDGGADVALFPEAVITGYDGHVFAGRLPNLADSSWLTPLRTVVDRTGIAAVVNTALQREGSRSLTTLLLVPGYEPVDAYDKQHLYEDERPIFTPGVSGTTITVKGMRIALSVCYDANFPEHAAAAARAGAHVYANSGAYFPGGEHRRDLHYAARALDNGMYVAFSGLVGAPHGFIGGSTVFDPLGRRIATVGEGRHLAFADMDPQVIDEARATQRMWTHRRDDLGSSRHRGPAS
ncbi:carbon-nitrogen hydrolase family protein [Microbacterium sp. 22296]|uniref:carbon-nitrogen hydrolase family protein n=1 Tax=Microbacterium sp. 22296 TaxID=3453903 RepID=UPI003F865637